MENYHFEWINQPQLALFNSYVSLPEGSIRMESVFFVSNMGRGGGYDVLVCANK